MFAATEADLEPQIGMPFPEGGEFARRVDPEAGQEVADQLVLARPKLLALAAPEEGARAIRWRDPGRDPGTERSRAPEAHQARADFRAGARSVFSHEKLPSF